MKEKVFRFIFIIGFYIIMFNLCSLGIVTIFYMNYSEWINAVLLLISITIASFGIYQLVSRKFNFKYLSGRLLGVIILSSIIFIIPLFYVNTINKTLFNSSNDKETLLDRKLALI